MDAFLLPDGRMLVPLRASEGGRDGAVGDGMVAVSADHPEAVKWLAWYRRLGKKPPRKAGAKEAEQYLRRAADAARRGDHASARMYRRQAEGR